MLSVITVVKNSKSSIEKTVQSVLSQQNILIEYIVIDCNSTDGTSDILNKYKNNIIYIREKDSGLYDALNKGIKLATKKYVAILHSGDEYTSTSILSQNLNFLENNGLCGSFANINIIKDGQIFRKWNYNIKTISKYNCFLIAHPSLILQKKIFDEIEYNINYKISSDLDFLLRLSKVSNLKIKYFDDYITNCIYGGLSTDIKYFKKRAFEDINILKKYFKYSYLFLFFLKKIYKIKNFTFKINL
jgi:glycosyltransferase involved in cell wall biosynthesis